MDEGKSLKKSLLQTTIHKLLYELNQAFKKVVQKLNIFTECNNYLQNLVIVHVFFDNFSF